MKVAAGVRDERGTSRCKAGSIFLRGEGKGDGRLLESDETPRDAYAAPRPDRSLEGLPLTPQEMVMDEPENLDHITLDRTCDAAARPGWDMREALRIDGAECWAIANGCQGIFPDTIRDSRAEVEALQKELNYPDDQIVPVRCYVDFKDDWLLRGWQEAERAKARA